MLDTALVSISRARRGLLPFASPGKDHAAHRLANLGLGQRGAVLVLYVSGAASGGTAVLVSYLPANAILLTGMLAVGLALVAIALLERAPYERQESANKA